MKKLSKTTILLLLFALFSFQTSAWASDTAAANALEIKLTPGSGNIVINGDKLTVEPPYLSEGVTLVPLRVITTAFGAVVTWDSITQTVGLKFNGTTIHVTINSKIAIVNGQALTMKTAPQLHNGTTMVPLRFITENFGATVAFNDTTKEVTIVGASPSDAASSSGLNNDAGKTKIGDSYNNWTMKYPTGLVKTDQTFKGTFVDFSDANDEYSLHIHIADSDAQSLSSAGLLTKLADTIKDTILNKSTVTSNGISYAKTVSKNKDGIYTEAHAIFSNGKIYFITMDVDKEANYINPLKYAGYKELLESFTPSFDAKDLTIKDLSTAKDGYRNYANDDYGFSLNVPADWFKDDDNGSNFHFYSGGTANQEFYITVSSIAVGDTLNTWVAREDLDFTNMFAADYRTNGIDQPTLINGVAAIENDTTQNPYGEWVTDNTLYVMKGSLKYVIEYISPKDTAKTEIDNRTKALISSFVFTNKVSPSLGFIEDSKADLNVKTKITNKELGLSIELPEYWAESTTNEEKNGGIAYVFGGGGLSIFNQTKTKDEVVKSIQASLKNEPDTKILLDTNVMVAGVNVNKIVDTYISEGASFTESSFTFTHNNKTYSIYYSIRDSFATAIAAQRYEDAIASIQFTP